jgi:hypothetical protein
MRALNILEIVHSMGRSNKLESTDQKVKEAAEALKSNIAVNGIISAITLVSIIVGENKGKYLCVDGNQRLWCYQALGHETIENYTIKTDATAGDTGGIEASANFFHIPETKKEFSERVKNAMAAGKTVAQIAAAWGIDVRTIEVWAGINTLPENIREKVITGELGLTAVDKVAKAGKRLNEEEKQAILSTMTKTTTAEQAQAIVAAKVAEKKTKNILANIEAGGNGKLVPEVKKVKPVLSMAKAESIMENVIALRASGRNDASFLLVSQVMDYIYGVSPDNPFKA